MNIMPSAIIRRVVRVGDITNSIIPFIQGKDVRVFDGTLSDHPALRRLRVDGILMSSCGGVKLWSRCKTGGKITAVSQVCAGPNAQITIMD